jgi:hypothetical protein
MWPFRKVFEVHGVVPPHIKPKHKWPDCDPVDKSDPYWEFNNNLNINGVNYLKREVAPGRWQWVENEEANRRQWERECRKMELFHALWTRALTQPEEEEAISHGDALNIQNCVPYRAEEKQRELHNAWFQQRRLQMLARTETAQLQQHDEATNVNETRGIGGTNSD